MSMCPFLLTFFLIVPLLHMKTVLFWIEIKKKFLDKLMSKNKMK